MTKKKQVDDNSEELMLEEIIPKRYRCFTFVLYDESIHYKLSDIMFNIKGFKYWAWIKHHPDEEEKQEHYHLILLNYHQLVFSSSYITSSFVISDQNP